MTCVESRRCLAFLRHEPLRLQGIQHPAKGERGLLVIDKPLTEINQRRVMKAPGIQVHVERQFPAKVVFERLDSLAVGQALQELEDQYAHQQHRFDSGAPVVRAIALLQFGAAASQDGPNLRGKE